MKTSLTALLVAALLGVSANLQAQDNSRRGYTFDPRYNAAPRSDHGRYHSNDSLRHQAYRYPSSRYQGYRGYQSYQYYPRQYNYYSPYSRYYGSPYRYYRSPSYYGGGYSSWGYPYSSYSSPFRGYSQYYLYR